VPTTSSQQSDDRFLTSPTAGRDLVAPVSRPGRRGRRQQGAGSLTTGRGPHVLLIGADGTGDRYGATAHTTGLAEHLAGTAATVSVRRQAPVADAGRHSPGGDLGFLTGALTATLPHAPDVVLGVTPGLGGAIAAARIARRHRAPLVLVVHDVLSARPRGTGGRALTVAGAAERRVLRAAAQLAVTSPELAERVYELGVGPERVHLLPHWAPDGAEPPDRLAARRALGWPIRPFTVVLLADGGTRPDLATVGTAAELLQGEAQFILVGQVVPRSAVPAQRAVPGVVRRVGPLSDRAQRQALAAADLLVIAERPDTTGLPLPGTLAHCLAAGRPVLAAVPEAGSVAGELERSAGAGLILPPGDPRVLAAATRALILDETGRLQMGRAAERYAADRLSRTGVMRAFAAMLRAALDETLIDLTPA
jgi:colanic acid biosynthesis glycosyl transferase WcaI